MKFQFKKILSVFLVFILVFSVLQINIIAKSKNNIPVIVINGIEHNPLYANSDTLNATQMFPPADMNVYALLVEMFTSSIVSLASNDYNQVMNFFVGSQLYDIMEKISLNPDGTSKSENVGPIRYEHSLAYYYTDTERYEKIAGNIGLGLCDRIGMDNVYVFTYDWRIDPVANANELNDFIQTVKANSRKDKVSIMSEGYGSTIAFAYLAEHYEDATADIDNFVTVNSAAMGTSLIGDIYTGRLMRQYNELRNATSAFIRFTNDFSDNPLTWFSTWLTNYILNNEWETQDLIAQCITMMGHVTDPLYDRYLRDMLKNFIGLWAMVPVEYYEEAMDFMFMSDESTEGDYNSEFQEKVQLYKNYQSSAAEILNKAKSEGININVVSSWDLQLIPIGDNKASDEEIFGLSAQSDGLIDTYFSSFGCHTIPLNDVGAAIDNKDQRNQEGECGNHNHMNAVYDTLDPEHDLGGIAHYLDASTCALPDNTWFIRNMKHGTFKTGSNSMDFLVYLLTADKTLDVFSADGLYMQFMSYNRYVKPGYLQIPDFDTSSGKYMLGDVNLDGKITAADARLALRISAKLENYPATDSDVFKNSDVNADGKITAADARIILRVSAGLSDFEDFRNTSDADE